MYLESPISVAKTQFVDRKGNNFASVALPELELTNFSSQSDLLTAYDAMLLVEALSKEKDRFSSIHNPHSLVKNTIELFVSFLLARTNAMFCSPQVFIRKSESITAWLTVKRLLFHFLGCRCCIISESERTQTIFCTVPQLSALEHLFRGRLRMKKRVLLLHTSCCTYHDAVSPTDRPSLCFYNPQNRQRLLSRFIFGSFDWKIIGYVPTCSE